MRAASLTEPLGRTASPRRTGSGGTLIEVLVAMTVMSTGMLGVAALFSEGLKSGRLSLHRITAVQLAVDMAERIRGNPGVPHAYGSAAQNIGCANSGIRCTRNQLAADDLFRWQLNIKRQLPVGALGTILQTSTASGNRYQINVAWPDGGFAAPLNYALAVRVAATTR
jgi:type IV pilus assembly protein PilV